MGVASERNYRGRPSTGASSHPAAVSPAVVGFFKRVALCSGRNRIENIAGKPKLSVTLHTSCDERRTSPQARSIT